MRKRKLDFTANSQSQNDGCHIGFFHFGFRNRLTLHTMSASKTKNIGLLKPKRIQRKRPNVMNLGNYFSSFEIGRGINSVP
jgi:hypothetical protein